MSRSTRGSLRTFYNVACSLPVLNPEHDLEEEIPVFDKFLAGIIDSGAKIHPISSAIHDVFSETGFAFTDKAAW
jgi:hypothetical protein